MDDKAKFFELADAAKLTKPQRGILELLRDDRILIVDKHHMSGGRWIWENRGDIGGKVYTPFWNLMRAVLQPNGYRVNVRYLDFFA